jgi:LytS/YehU family sensor histidine kinase
MVAGYFISYFLIELEHAGSQSSWTSVLALAMHRCHANLTTITIIAVLIKIMKDDYYRQREHEMLAVENLANRLRLLKLQLHPRVLFSSLDSIYAEMEKGSSRAPRMILKLSDLLSYLLYRSDGERIPLSSEVEMIGNYIQLKKLQYPDRMDIHLYSDDIRIDHLVPPGLFLPILEIGMEPPDDGRKPVTVEIGVSTSSSKVYFSMTNNRRGLDALQASAARLALEQLRARLQSLLSGKFRLNVEPGPEDLLISMELGIDKPVKTRQ